MLRTDDPVLLLRVGHSIGKPCASRAERSVFCETRFDLGTSWPRNSRAPGRRRSATGRGLGRRRAGVYLNDRIRKWRRRRRWFRCGGRWRHSRGHRSRKWRRRHRWLRCGGRGLCSRALRHELRTRRGHETSPILVELAARLGARSRVTKRRFGHSLHNPGRWFGCSGSGRRGHCVVLTTHPGPTRADTVPRRLRPGLQRCNHALKQLARFHQVLVARLRVQTGATRKVPQLVVGRLHELAYERRNAIGVHAASTFPAQSIATKAR